MQQEVFLLKADDPESIEIGKTIENQLENNGIRVISDKDLKYKQSFSEFKDKLSEAKSAIAIISEDFLKSEKLMEQLISVYKNPDFKIVVHPIVLESAKINDPIALIDYMNYWENKKEELNNKIKSISNLANMASVYSKLDFYTEVRRLFSKLTEFFQDVSSYSTEKLISENFKPLIEAVNATEQKQKEEFAKYQTIVNNYITITGNDNIVIQDNKGNIDIKKNS